LSLRDIIPKELDFLIKKALELESVDSKIIPTYKIFIERIVILKYRSCLGYGKNFPGHRIYYCCEF
jgi:predicted metal-binding protein